MEFPRGNSGVATGEMGGSGPHFCADPSWDLRKSVEKCFIYGGGGIPIHVYCDFLLLTSKEKLFGSPTFFGLATPLRGNTSIALSPGLRTCVFTMLCLSKPEPYCEIHSPMFLFIYLFSGTAHQYKLQSQCSLHLDWRSRDVLLPLTRAIFNGHATTQLRNYSATTEATMTTFTYSYRTISLGANPKKWTS